MTERIRNTTGAAAPQPPTHPNGRPYQFEMITDGGRWRVYADEPADLVAELIDGYERLLSPVDRAEARARYAVGAQVAVQAALVNEYGLGGCTEQETQLLLGERSEPPTPASWQAPVPLVLVAAFYQPVQPRPRPTAQDPGEIWWIDPADDVSLLRDLHSLAVIQLAGAAQPPAGQPPATGKGS